MLVHVLILSRCLESDPGWRAVVIAWVNFGGWRVSGERWWLDHGRWRIDDGDGDGDGDGTMDGDAPDLL